MSSFRGWMFATLCLAVAGVSLAQEVQEPTRSGFLMERAGLVRMERVEEDGTARLAELVETPLLKYTNPLYRAQSDGLLLAWVVDSVPVALVSYSIRNERDVFRELAICSDSPLRCTIEERLIWTPNPTFRRRRIGTTIDVPANDRLRLRMMKRLAERFKSGKKRVLPTPVYRYQSSKAGVIDGGVFVLTDTNDPEILILIEAVQPEGESSAAWQYSLARMNSHPQQVHLDGQLVWDLQGYWRNPQSKTDPYAETRDSQLPSELRRGNDEQ